MSQEHSHSHTHPAPTFNTFFLIAIVANGLFVILQILYANITHSTSLLADAIHNLGDVLSLIMAWVGHYLLQRIPTARSTYGMKKTSILAALANGLLLVFTCGFIAAEAVYKLFSPTEIQTIPVMVVAAVGVLVNGVTAALFMRHQGDLNLRGAFLHLLYDAVISLGVVISSAVIYWTHQFWIDPIVALIIAGIIIKGTWSLFSDSFRLIIDGVPRHISLIKVCKLLQEQPGVQGVHDLHIWALSTQENALSVHLWMPQAPMTDEHRLALCERLRHEYHIQHTTIQVERIKTCEDRCHVYL